MDEIKLASTISLVPPVYYLLSAVGEGQFSYQYYGVRHPGGIFSVQFSDVLRAFNELAQVVNNLQGVGMPCSQEGGVKPEVSY